LELRYLFKVGGAPNFDAGQRMLSDQMISYWSQFVTNNAPKAAGLPEWPAKSGDPTHNFWMSLRPGNTRVITNFEESHQCAFWASLKGRS
jgi:para-nitrobenzyl esterase